MKRRISRYIIIFLFMLFLQYSTTLNVTALIKSASKGSETTISSDIELNNWDPSYVGLKVGVLNEEGKLQKTYVFLNKKPPTNTVFATVLRPKSKASKDLIDTGQVGIKGIDAFHYTYYRVNFKNYFDNNGNLDENTFKILDSLPTSWKKQNSSDTYIDMNDKLNASNFQLLNKILKEFEKIGELSHGDYILIEPMVKINRYYGTAFELMNTIGIVGEPDTTKIPADYLTNCTKSGEKGTDSVCINYASILFGGNPSSNSSSSQGLLYNTLTVNDNSNKIDSKVFKATEETHVHSDHGNENRTFLKYSVLNLRTTIGNWKESQEHDAFAKYQAATNNSSVEAKNSPKIRNQCLRSKSCPGGIGVFRYINACAADFENKADNTMATRVGLYMKWGKRSLLNLNITDPIQACTDAPVSTETTRGCFYGGVNAKPNSFDESNLSGYNDIYYYQSKGILGFCMTTFNMNGNNYLKFKDGFAQENYQTALAFSGNAGQLLFVGRDKSMSTAAMVTINKSCYMFSTEDNENYSTVTGTDYYRNSIATKGDGGKMYIVENPAYNDGTSRTQLSIDVSDSNSESPLYNDYVAIGVTNTMVQDNEEYSDLELKDDAEAETEMDYGKAQLTNQIRRLALYRNEENKNLYTSGDISFYLNFPQAIAKKDNGAFVPYYNKLRADSNTYAGDNKTVRSKIIKEAEDGHYIYDLSYENLTNNIDFKNYIQKNYDESNTTLDLYGAISSPYDYRFIGYGIPTKLHIPEEDLSGRLNVNVKFRRFEFNINSDEGTVGVKQVEEDASGYCLYGLDNQILTPKLSLEFRIIDTKNPFPGRNGNGRTVGNNWCYKDATTGNLDCSSSDSNKKIKEHITDANDSYNKNYIKDKNSQPKYTIELSPETIKQIRTYNKDNPYDDYTIKKNESTGKITSNFLEKHYINIEI